MQVPLQGHVVEHHAKGGTICYWSGSGSDHSNYQPSYADMAQTSRSGQGNPRAGEQGDQDQDERTSLGSGGADLSIKTALEFLDRTRRLLEDSVFRDRSREVTR